MNPAKRFLGRLGFGLASCCLLLASSSRAADPITSPMYTDPDLPVPRRVIVHPKGAAALWIEALDRPDATTKCAAAQSISLAHRQGMPGLAAAVPVLVRELERADQHPTVRVAAARALVSLDAQPTADNLLRQLASDDAELRDVIEPALARWDHKPARALWLARLDQPPPYHRAHLLAIEALGQVKEEKAAPRLRELVLSRDSGRPARLAAARALAILRASGSEADAATLAADTSAKAAPERLLAASLLRHHQGDAAVKLLQSLGRDADPTVAAVALARLTEIDTKLVLPLLEPVLASPDANVRAFGVEVLLRQPTDDRVRLLGDRLADPHPDVRGRAREALRELAAKPEFNAGAIREGTRVLAGKDWRGQEQAAILLAHLGHKPAAKRLIELLRVERPEAFIAAAWALRELAVPDTVPVVLEFVREHHKKMLAGSRTAGRNIPEQALDRQLSQLVQFLGQARHQPAGGLLLEMLPRIVPGQPGTPPQTPLGEETRAAVMWSLGLLHEGKPDAAVVSALEARLNDLPKPFLGGEWEVVRRMAAVSIGRMKGKDALPSLRKFYEGKPTLDPVNNACGWAIWQITGEPMPPPGVAEFALHMWFWTRNE